MDYNKLPGYLFWSLHLVWLFPWALFLGVLIREAVAALRRYYASNPLQSDQISYCSPLRSPWSESACATPCTLLPLYRAGRRRAVPAARPAAAARPTQPRARPLLRVETFAQRTTLLLTLYLRPHPHLLLHLHQPGVLHLPRLPAAADAPRRSPRSRGSCSHKRHPLPPLDTLRPHYLHAHRTCSRHRSLPRPVELAPSALRRRHRRPCSRTAASAPTPCRCPHFFDLTGPSFAAPASPRPGLAALTLALGPALAWWMRLKTPPPSPRRSPLPSPPPVFLVAAHIAFVRFAPMLSSQNLAEKIGDLEAGNNISRDNQLIL